MSRFRFGLEALLRVRKSQLDGGQALLAAALRTLEEAQRAGRAAQQRGLAEYADLARGLAQGLDGRAVATAAQGAEHAWSQLRAQEAAGAEARVDSAKRREELVQARRRLRVVERLRERAAERHSLAERRRQQRALDDATACLRARLGGRA